MKKIAFLIFCLFLLAQPSYAQNEPKEMVDLFFRGYKEDPFSAIDYIFSTNNWITKNNQEGIKNMEDRLEQLMSYIGVYSGYELVKEEKIGRSLIVYHYLVRYERQPILFKFIFYKADEQWSLYNFEFNTEIEAFIKENM